MTVQILQIKQGPDPLVAFVDSKDERFELRASDLRELLQAIQGAPWPSREFVVFDPLVRDRMVIDWLDGTGDDDRRQTFVDYRVKVDSETGKRRLLIAVAGRVVWESVVGYKIPVEGSLTELEEP